MRCRLFGIVLYLSFFSVISYASPEFEIDIIYDVNMLLDGGSQYLVAVTKTRNIVYFYSRVKNDDSLSEIAILNDREISEDSVVFKKIVLGLINWYNRRKHLISHDVFDRNSGFSETEYRILVVRGLIEEICSRKIFADYSNKLDMESCAGFDLVSNSR